MCVLDSEQALSSAHFFVHVLICRVWSLCVDLFVCPRLLFASPCALISMRFCIKAFVNWQWHCMLAKHKRSEVFLR